MPHRAQDMGPVLVAVGHRHRQVRCHVPGLLRRGADAGLDVPHGVRSHVHGHAHHVVIGLHRGVVAQDGRADGGSSPLSRRSASLAWRSAILAWCSATLAASFAASFESPEVSGPALPRSLWRLASSAFRASFFAALLAAT